MNGGGGMEWLVDWKYIAVFLLMFLLKEARAFCFRRKAY